jgi:hypothetical protein
MLWKTHIRIAYEILSRLGIPKSGVEATKLREGEVAPDEWGDYPHHYGKSSSIRKYIMRARKFFLSGNLSDAYFCLGVALHYIQDSYTSLTSRSEHHQHWEQQIEQSYFTDNLEDLVARAFCNRKDRIKEYMEIIGFLSMEIEGKNNTLRLATLREGAQWEIWGVPDVDFNFAFRASFLIAKSVLGSKTCRELQTQLNRVLAEHEAMLRETEAVVADKILELIRKRDELEKHDTQAPEGIFATLREYFSDVLGRIYNWRAASKIGQYEQQKHLKKIAREYQNIVQKIIAPHVDWFNITVPKIDINVVEKELLSPQEALRNFRIGDTIFKYLVEKGKIACYRVRNKEIIKKSELEKSLRI